MNTSDFFSNIMTWVLANGFGVFTAIIVLIFGWFFARLAARTIKTLTPKTSKIDDTIGPLLSQLAKYGILIVALIIALNQLGVATSSMLAVLGAAGLAIALALQGTLSNVAAGVMIIWLRPFSIGEYIEGAGIEGTIKEIGLFSTKIKNANGLFIFAPNSLLWSASIINHDREPKRRINLKIGISYDADIEKARKALINMATSQDKILKNPAPAVVVNSLDASAVTLSLRAWTKSANYWDMSFIFNEQAKLALDKAKIEIPYNKIDVNMISK